MADDRDDWLDRDAAEKLLRGEPVVPPGAQARSAARSLSEALGATRPGSSAEGEMRGEEAALAAFRHAGPARGAAGAGRHRRPVGPGPEAGTAPGAGMLDPVRLGTPPSPSRSRERPRFGRPVRIGLAASLAGCALGGVAVAAGTGALTGAFGGTEHSPASTVSVAASPDDATPEASGTDTPSGAPTGTGDPSVQSPGGASQGAGAGGATSGTGAPDSRNGAGTEGSSGGHGGGYGDGHGSPDRDTYGSAGGSGGSGSDGYAEAVEDCRDYRDGDLDERERRRLAELARGEKNVPEYCARITASYPGGSVAGDGPDGSAPDESAPDGTGYGSGHAGDGKGEWGQDAYRQGQSFAYSLRNAPAGGPAGTTGDATFAAAPTAKRGASAPKTVAQTDARAGAKTDTRAGARARAKTDAETGVKAGAKAVPAQTLSTDTAYAGAWAPAPGAGGPGAEAAERTGRTGQAGWTGQAGQGAQASPGGRGGRGGQDAGDTGRGTDEYAEPGSGAFDRTA
ncbi:hypothetical protein OG599_21565 [Streptomyces sp. NBC_01335]|uniref:hypothetical protein n=1 Tax=Streptomyces sp. NBC_01335 TaxID=2903828 RepID=UPI002E15884F|nr:hypothetical protein OG599_21565 [Streptomyces sp. NBC_01335]